MGQIWVLREFLPAMVKMDRGSIIFMCGLPGHAGAPNMSVTLMLLRFFLLKYK